MFRERVLPLNKEKDGEGFSSFAAYVGELLEMPISVQRPRPGPLRATRTLLNRVEMDGELVLVQAPSCTAWDRLRWGNPLTHLARCAPTSMLVFSKPRWPFRNILLILCNRERDEAAVDWTLRLAPPSHARVTILPIVPSLPDYLPRSNDRGAILNNLIYSNTPAGKRLLGLMERLDEARIPYRIALERGASDWQIAQALASTEYELLVSAGESRSRLDRWLCGEVVAPLMRWLDGSILIAFPHLASPSNAYARNN